MVLKKSGGNLAIPPVGVRRYKASSVCGTPAVEATGYSAGGNVVIPASHLKYRIG